MKILALDIGTRRVGLALCDAGGLIASPLCVVERNPRFIERIKELIAEHQVERLVLGQPLNMDGSVGAAAQAVEKLARQLQGELKLPVDLHDERLTSEEARRAMFEAGVKRSKKKGLEDAFAAALILESYLKEQKTGEKKS